VKGGGYDDDDEKGASELSTTSMRASPTLFLTETVSLDVGNSWPVATRRADAAYVEWFS